MRVDAATLAKARRDIANRGERYTGAELDGVIIDLDHALDGAGFTHTRISTTGDGDRMVLCTCDADPLSGSLDDVIERLETAWTEDAAFGHEVHTLSRDTNGLSLDFVTWWDSGAYYTGRIDLIALAQASVAST